MSAIPALASLKELPEKWASGAAEMFVSSSISLVDRVLLFYFILLALRLKQQAIMSGEGGLISKAAGAESGQTPPRGILPAPLSFAFISYEN